jgi:hypothetical protein
MHVRMTQPAMVLPDAYRAMLALSRAAKRINVWNRLNVATRQPPAGARAAAAVA